MEMDSLVVVHLVKDELTAYTNNTMLMDINNLMKWSWEIKATHVYRERNKVANVMANLALCSSLGHHLLLCSLQIVHYNEQHL